MRESNSVVSAYTTYRRLQQYCSHPSIKKPPVYIWQDKRWFDQNCTVVTMGVGAQVVTMVIYMYSVVKVQLVVQLYTYKLVSWIL